MTLACDALGTAEIKVNGIAKGLYMAGSSEQVVGVVGAKLDEQGTVGFVVAVEMVVVVAELRLVIGIGCVWHRALERLEVGLAVFGILMEQARVEHGSVGEQLLVLLGRHE